MIRLQRGVNGTRQATVAFELAGGAAVAWDEADETLGRHGLDFLTRQAEIGGGTTEMARNVISERVSACRATSRRQGHRLPGRPQRPGRWPLTGPAIRGTHTGPPRSLRRWVWSKALSRQS